MNFLIFFLVSATSAVLAFLSVFERKREEKRGRGDWKPRVYNFFPTLLSRWLSQFASSWVGGALDSRALESSALDSGAHESAPFIHVTDRTSERFSVTPRYVHSSAQGTDLPFKTMLCSMVVLLPKFRDFFAFKHMSQSRQYAPQESSKDRRPRIDTGCFTSIVTKENDKILLLVKIILIWKKFWKGLWRRFFACKSWLFYENWFAF